MVCSICDGETEVTNSRLQKRNNQIWRRRRCLECKSIFTTHESVYLPAIFSVKRGRLIEPFTPDRLLSEIMYVLRDKPKAYEDAKELNAVIIRNTLKKAADGLISPQEISLEASKVLKRFNKQAWLRYQAEHPSLQS